MSDGQITNGQREAHALDGINAHAQSSSPPTRSNSQPLTHHRSRGRYPQPGFSWKGRQLWQIPPSLNGYRISLRSVRHASSL